MGGWVGGWMGGWVGGWVGGRVRGRVGGRVGGREGGWDMSSERVRAAQHAHESRVAALMCQLAQHRLRRHTL